MSTLNVEKLKLRAFWLCNEWAVNVVRARISSDAGNNQGLHYYTAISQAYRDSLLCLQQCGFFDDFRCANKSDAGFNPALLIDGKWVTCAEVLGDAQKVI
jgi:hypothetical protein